MGSSPGGTSTDMVSIEGTQRPEMRSTAVGQDPRVTAGIVANCGLGLLDETAAAVRRMAHVHTSPGRVSRVSLPVLRNKYHPLRLRRGHTQFLQTTANARCRCTSRKPFSAPRRGFGIAA